MSYRQLRESGASRSQIDSAVAAGSIKRVIRGWYAYPTADQRVVSALRAGGRLGCLTGCAFHGLWTPHHAETHVVYGRGMETVPRKGLCLHSADRPQPRAAVWGVLDCLSDVLHRHDLETGLIVCESALYHKLITLDDLLGVAASLPGGATRFLRYLAPAESGSETRVRLFLQLRGVQVECQVELPGIGRVDHLVGKRLIIECDSEEHHSSREQRHKDLSRDLVAVAAGYEVLRLDYHHIWRLWPSAQQILLHRIRRRRHQLAPR